MNIKSYMKQMAFCCIMILGIIGVSVIKAENPWESPHHRHRYGKYEPGTMTLAQFKRVVPEPYQTPKAQEIWVRKGLLHKASHFKFPRPSWPSWGRAEQAAQAVPPAEYKEYYEKPIEGEFRAIEPKSLTQAEFYQRVPQKWHTKAMYDMYVKDKDQRGFLSRHKGKIAGVAGIAAAAYLAWKLANAIKNGDGKSVVQLMKEAKRKEAWDLVKQMIPTQMDRLKAGLAPYMPSMPSWGRSPATNSFQDAGPSYEEGVIARGRRGIAGRAAQGIRGAASNAAKYFGPSNAFQNAGPGYYETREAAGLPIAPSSPWLKRGAQAGAAVGAAGSLGTAGYMGYKKYKKTPTTPPTQVVPNPAP